MLFATALLALPLALAAQVGPGGGMRSLELAECLELARAHDARLDAVSLDEQAALWDHASSWQRVLPTLSAETSILRNAREIKIGSGADERIVSPLYVPRAAATARLALLRAPDVPSALAAWQRHRAVVDEAEETRDALLADVTALFLDLAELVRAEVAQAEAASRARALLRVAESRVAAGEGVPLEATDAEAEALRVEAELATTQGERAAVEALLRLRLGLDESETLIAVCQDCIPAPDVPDTSSAAIAADARRGDLAGLTHRANAARIEEVAGWASLLPVVEVVGDLRLSQPTLFNPDPVWWTAQLVLRWDLIGPTPGAGGVLSSLALDRRAALASLRAGIARSEADAASSAAQARLASRAQSAVASRARVQAAARALEQAEARYAAGLLSSADVIEVARRKAEADRDLARAEIDEQRARLAFRRALGLPPVGEGARHD